MEISVNQQEKGITLSLSGRLDTVTSPSLEAEIQKLPTDIEELNFDFANLAFISSAGLRVLLSAQKKMDALKAKLVILNANETVKEVFNITGLDELLTIK